MKQYFTSEKNYLKRSPLSGSTSISAPSGSLVYGYVYQSTFVIPHNLGYIPMVRVYYEPDASNGRVYPATGRRLAGLGPGLSYGSVMCLWECDENNLTIYLESATTKTGSRNIYWVIYLDS